MLGLTSCEDRDSFYYYGRDSWLHDYLSFDYLEVDLGEDLGGDSTLPIVCVYQFSRDGRGVEYLKGFDGTIIEDRSIFYNVGFSDGTEFIEINYYGDKSHKEYYRILTRDDVDLVVRHYFSYFDFRDDIDGYNTKMFRIPHLDLPLGRTRTSSRK